MGTQMFPSIKQSAVHMMTDSTPGGQEKPGVQEFWHASRELKKDSPLLPHPLIAVHSLPTMP
jgi:hypothetical protein